LRGLQDEHKLFVSLNYFHSRKKRGSCSGGGGGKKQSALTEGGIHCCHSTEWQLYVSGGNIKRRLKRGRFEGGKMVKGVHKSTKRGSGPIKTFCVGGGGKCIQPKKEEDSNSQTRRVSLRQIGPDFFVVSQV